MAIRHHRLRACRPAVPWILAPALLGGVLAAPAQAQSQRTQPQWHLEVMGNTGGYLSTGVAINGRGQVAGESYSLVLGTPRFGWVWQPDGSVTLLNTSGRAGVSGINLHGDVAGALDGMGSVWSAGQRFDVGLPGASSSQVIGINNARQLVGRSATSAGLVAFSGHLGGVAPMTAPGPGQVLPVGINDSGQIAANYFPPAPDTRGALRYDGTSFTRLADSSGAFESTFARFITQSGTIYGSQPIGLGAAVWDAGSSQARALLPPTAGLASASVAAANDLGVAVGSAQFSNGSSSGALFHEGQVLPLNTLPVFATEGWQSFTATGINNDNQIVGEAWRDRDIAAYRLTLLRTTFDSPRGGSWDTRSSWAYGLLPTATTEAFIELAQTGVVRGPGAGLVGALTVGQDATRTLAATTLELAGSRITLSRDFGRSGMVEIKQRGALTGQGEFIFLSGDTGMMNTGRVTVQDLVLRGGYLSNAGVLDGHGRLVAEGGVLNAGQLRANDGSVLWLPGTGVLNFAGGRVELLGGELDLQTLTNEGRVLMVDGRLRGQVINLGGRIDVGAGTSELIGELDNQGLVVVSGHGALTVDAPVRNGGEIRVSAGASATFFDDFVDAGGTLTGSGAKFFEAGFSIEGAGRQAAAEGALAFGDAAALELDIGGAGPDGHARLAVDGALQFGGTLVLRTTGSFVAQVGQRIDLLDWTAASGTFDRVDAQGVALAEGALLDFSRLYVDGSISVTAVPEPGTWALWLAGAAAVAGVARRRSQAG